LQLNTAKAENEVLKKKLMVQEELYQVEVALLQEPGKSVSNRKSDQTIHTAYLLLGISFHPGSSSNCKSFQDILKELVITNRSLFQYLQQLKNRQK
jgi:hypothetical protein